MNDDPHQHHDRDSDSSDGQYHRRSAPGPAPAQGSSATHNFNGNVRASEKGKRKSDGFASRQAYGQVAESRDGSIMGGGTGMGTGTGTDLDSVAESAVGQKKKNRRSKKQRITLRKAAGGKEAEMDLDEDEEDDRDEGRGRRDRPIEVDDDDDDEEDMDLDDDSATYNNNRAGPSSTAPIVVDFQQTLPRQGDSQRRDPRNHTVSHSDRRDFWANKGPRQVADTPDHPNEGGRAGGRNGRARSPPRRQPSPITDYSNIKVKDTTEFDDGTGFIAF